MNYNERMDPVKKQLSHGKKEKMLANLSNLSNFRAIY